jgi:signal transduction histidine kinase
MALPLAARVMPIVALALVASESIRASLSAQAPLRTVLTIHADAENHPANQVLDAAIRESLASRDDIPIDYFSEYLDADRFGAEEASFALDGYIRQKYRGRRIDLVIATHTSVLPFVVERRRGLFPGAPIVSSGLSVPDGVTRAAGPGIAAVKLGIAHVETLKSALELHPSTEQVFVVAKSTNQQSKDAVRLGLRAFSSRVRLTYIDEQTLPLLLSAVRAVPPRSLILYVWDNQVERGNVLYSDAIARLVARAATVPVYGTSDLYVGSGVVGGLTRRTHETGTRLGEMALQILDGTRAQDIPIEAARIVPIFDWRQLRRWGIDVSRLPPGSDIRFRTPTAWESYREYIVGTVTVLAAQLLLIAGLLTQRARRQRAEETILIREATLRTSFERIRQLTGRLINAQEQARADIARDLHDDVCQDLVGVALALRSLRQSSGHYDAPTQQALLELEEWAVDMVNGVRRLSHELHPATLPLLGLGSALKAHCLEVERRHDVQVSFTSDDDLKRVQPDVALCLFRIAQEALRNGAVHGDARRLGVTLARTGEHVELTVADDGCGFDLEAVRRDGSGLGLVSIEERAHLVGGYAQIVTGLGQGTSILVRVPAGADVKTEKHGGRVHMPMVARRSLFRTQEKHGEPSETADRRRPQGLR